MNCLEGLYRLKECQHSKLDLFKATLSEMPIEYQLQVANHWYFDTARFNQIIPWHEKWTEMVFKPGRGFGKNWMLSRNSLDYALNNPGHHINCFAASQSECNDTLILGESGIAKAAEERGYELIAGTKRDHPAEGKIIYLFSKDHIQLRFPNKALMRFYSATKTRGKQSHISFVDELFTWYELETNREAKLLRAYEEIKTTTRLGDNPRVVITSTPQPVLILKKLYEKNKLDPIKTRIINGTTFDNPYLSDSYKQDLIELYGGTRRGRQELYGSESWDVPGALWSGDMIKRREVSENQTRTVVAIDPAASNNKDSDETGIIVATKLSNGEYEVLEDLSGNYSPHEWATIAIQAYDRHKANKVVIETNMGGDMAVQTLKVIRSNLPTTRIHASKGKYARAEPIAALYEKGLVFHTKDFKELEDQLTSYNPQTSKASPDRLDALVYALQELKGTGTPVLGVSSGTSNWGRVRRR